MLGVLENPARRELVLRYARPALLPGGIAPEARAVFGGVGWAGYQEFDLALGHDRPGPRLYFLDGDLEIMSTSEEHERIRKRIADCLVIFFEAREIRDFARGQATMQLLEQTGAEPDESWCFGEEKPFPDLVLEIALTSGGLPKLEIYGRFPVPEVWLWRRGRLEIHCLRPDAAGYEPSPASRLLSTLPIAALTAAVEERDPVQARRAFRAAL
jgi:Uma2 family endonuclease